MKKMWYIVVIFLLFGTAFSQTWTVNIILEPRVNPYVEEWRSNPRMATVRITNPTSNFDTVTLYVTIEHKRHGRVLTGRSRPLRFRPHETRSLNNPDMVNWATVDYPRSLANLAMRTGLLPAGRYTICIDVQKDGKVLGRQCKDFDIILSSPPRLISPRDKDSVLSNPIFRWTSISTPYFMKVTYHFMLWRINLGENHTFVMRRKPYYSKKLSSTMLSYPSEAPLIESGKRYIWMVRSEDSEGNPIGSNRGKSEVWEIIGRPRLMAILPTVLKIGDFIVNVSSYSPGATFSDLSGSGTSFFVNTEDNDTVDFALDFEHLSAIYTGHDTANVYSGIIDVSISPPLLLIKKKFQINVYSLEMRPDSAVAELSLAAPGLYDTIGPQRYWIGPFETKVTKHCAFTKVLYESQLDPFRVDDYYMIFIPKDSVKIRVIEGPAGTSTAGSGSESSTIETIEYLEEAELVKDVATTKFAKIKTKTPSEFKEIDTDILTPSVSEEESGVKTVISKTGIPVYELMISYVSIKFFAGETKPQHHLKVNNTGYLFGKYVFENAIATKDGFNAKLELDEIWDFTSVIPYGYIFTLDEAELNFNNCIITDGYLKGEAILPDAENGLVNTNGDSVAVSFNRLNIDSTLQFSGECNFSGDVMNIACFGTGPAKYIGNFALDKNEKGNLRFTATPREFISLVVNDSIVPKPAKLDTMVGLTFEMKDEKDTITIYSKDIRAGSISLGCNRVNAWFVLEQQGVTGKIWNVIPDGELFNVWLGRVSDSAYKSEKPLHAHIMITRQEGFADFWVNFAGNSVIDVSMGGFIDTLPMPSKIKTTFDKMNLTSVADFIGGDVKVDSLATLAYWDLIFDVERGFVIPKMAELVFTNADLAETLHFSKPFNIIFGKILGDGKLENFVFNQNCAYQKFDGFPISLQKAELSPYDTTNNDLDGAIIVESYILFDFFGSTDTTIIIEDFKNNVIDIFPYFGRWIRLTPDTFALDRNWGNDLGTFDFPGIRYDTLDQNGFVGNGTVGLSYLIGGGFNTYLSMDSSSTRLCFDKGGVHSVQLGAKSLTAVDKIWGCMFIEGEMLKKIVVGGEQGASTGGAILEPISGAHNRFVMAITPSITQFSINGKMMMKSVELGLELHVAALFKFDRDVGYIEGDLKGRILASSGVPLSSIGLDARGQLSFHQGLDYSYIQGAAFVELYGAAGLCGASFGINGGVFIGINAPKEVAWVLMQQEGNRFGVSMGMLPPKLTGFYFFLDVQASLDLFLLGGSFELYIGYGMFQSLGSGAGFGCSYLPSLSSLGVLGIYIYGEVLWGLVSASGSLKLQLMAPCPGGFAGDITFRGCVLWVFCGSINLGVSVSTEEGFNVSEL